MEKHNCMILKVLYILETNILNIPKIRLRQNT